MGSPGLPFLPFLEPQNTPVKYIFGRAYVFLEVHCMCIRSALGVHALSLLAPYRGNQLQVALGSSYFCRYMRSLLDFVYNHRQ